MVLKSSGELFVGGQFASSVSGVTLSGIGRWQNGVWSGLDGGCKASDGTPKKRRVETLLIDGTGGLLACGYFDRMGSGTNNTTGYLARWNGTAWASVGPTTNNGSRPFDDNVGANTMALSPGGVLHVAYNNTVTDGHSLVRLASNVWQTIGNGFSGKPYSIVFDDVGGIYAGGTLSLTGPSPRHVLRGITYWDGSRWSSYGNEGLGMVNLTSTETVEIRAMARDNRGNLMIGGTFLGSYSGVVSPYLIRTRMGGYEIWPTLGGLPPAQLGPLDRNGPLGLQNLTAYAMALDPLVAKPGDLPQIVFDAGVAPAATADGDGALPAAADPAPTLKFRYRRSLNATGIIMRVESSTNLANWTPVEVLRRWCWNKTRNGSASKSRFPGRMEKAFSAWPPISTTASSR